jgi:hypothetical protein
MLAGIVLLKIGKRLPPKGADYDFAVIALLGHSPATLNRKLKQKNVMYICLVGLVGLEGRFKKNSNIRIL